MIRQHISRFVALISILSLLLGATGIPQTALAAPAGTALQFNGSSQYVTFGSSTGMDTGLGVQVFTIETWFKRTGPGVGTGTGSGGITSAIPLVTKGRAEADGDNRDMNYFLGIDAISGKLVADFEECAPTQTGCPAGGTAGLNHPVSGNTVIGNNVWHHAAVTYDGLSWKLYLDGSLDVQLTLSTPRYPRWDSIQHAGIGTAVTSTGVAAGFFQGVTDEVRIWNVVRTQAEIQSNMYNELTSGTGLIGRWGLNEGSGTIANNSIAGRPNGTLTNGPSWVIGFPDATPPAAPTGLSAVPGSSTVNLSWQANSEVDLAGYNVYRSTVAGGPYTKINGSLTTGSTYPDSGLANGTTYYYAITAVDTSANESGYSSEVSATPQPGAFALDFGSGTAYVSFGDPAKLDLAQFTIETWFKRTGAGTANTTGSGGIANAIPLVTHGAPEADGSNLDANWILAIDDATDVIAGDFEDTATGLNHPVRGTTVITDNVWHHAAATYDGTTWRLYLDGMLETTLAVNATPRSDSIQRAGLGTMLTSTGTALGHVQGVLDETRVWNVARTQADIVADINNQLTSGNGLVARWGFGEGAGTAVGDSIAVPANGTITNSGSSWVAGAPFNLVVDITPPAAPQNLVAAASNGQVSLTWNANSESDLAGYNLYRSTTSPVSTVTPLNSSLLTSPAYTDTSVTNGITYYYVVTALDTSNNASEPSNEVNATPTVGSAALQFDGTNDYVTFGPASSLGVATFTIETWFKRTGAGVGTNTGSGGIASAIPLLTKGRAEAEGSTVDMNYFLGIDSSTGKLVADFEDMATGTNHPVSGTTLISSNSWHHAAATYDGTTWKLYLDGNLETTLTIGQTPRFDSTQHAALATAMNSTGVAAGFFQGVLDEPRVWNYARTQAEIQDTLHTQVPSAAGLIGRWGLNEGLGTTANDSSGSGVNGTLTNGPTWVAGTTFNAAPIVNAGPDQSVVMPGGVDLHGTATDDGFPNPPATLTISWSKVSGPGTVTFSDSASANTSALFSAAGTYVLRLSASDGESTSTDDVTVAASLGGNTAINFGGTDAYVTFGDPVKLDLAHFTIETWFMRTGAGVPNTTGTNGIANFIPLVTHGSPQAEGSNVDANWMLGINDDNDVLAADFEDMATGANHPVSGTTLITDNVWHHAAATYDGSTWRLYLDGNLEATLAVNAAPRSDTIQHAALGTMIQSDGTTTNGRFQGTLDEARVWNRALSEAEIQTNMPLELTSGSGLVARWGLNEGAGTLVNDSISSPANGSVTGSNYTWVTGAPFAVNQPPNTPVLNSPADGTTGVSTSPTLDVTVSDPDSSNLTVSFYGKAAATIPPPGPDFTVIALPDTQYYTSSLNGGSPAIFNSQTQWIVDNIVSRNIAFVSQLGDCTEHGDQYELEWQNADTAFKTIENPDTTGMLNGMPYGIAPGNHDQTPIGDPNGTTTFYNQYFGITRFQGRGYYGGHYGSNNDNHYELFSASGMDFIVIHLEYDQSSNYGTSPVLAWADNLLQTYSNRRAILVSHYLINGGGSIAGGTNASWSTQGQAIYNAVKDNPNLFLMLSGHVPSLPEGQRKDVFNGHTIYTLMSDYQGRTNGGNGWLRIMTFSPANNTIQVKTYSPWLNQFETDADSQFTMSYEMQGGTVPFTTIGTNTNVPSGSNTSITWPNLTETTQYEWYATVTDGNKTTTSATYSFTTAAANTAPVAIDDTYNVNEDTILNVTSPGLLTNDTDADGDPLTAIKVTDPAHGTLTFNADGSLIYIPSANFNGVDSFTYKANDGVLDSNIVTVSITINAVNDAPVAVADSYTTEENTQLSVPIPGVKGNDSDADGDTLDAILVVGASHGTALLTVYGSFSYTPVLNFNGTDSFTYKLYDGTTYSNVVTVTINVTSVNNAPVCSNVSLITSEEVTAQADPSCSDADGDTLTYSIVDPATSGTTSVTAGKLTYEPNLNFNGSDSFTYRASDGTFNSNIAIVNVTVSAVNDSPVLGFIADQDVDELALLNFTATASDVDGDSLVFSLDGTPAGANITSGGAFTWTPTESQGPNGYTFDVCVSDGIVSDCQSIHVNVVEINSAPVLDPVGSQSVDEGSLLIFTVTASDSDLPANALTFSLGGTPPAGASIDANTGDFTWTPSEAQGPETNNFNINVSDGTIIDFETISVTINEVNIAPVANSQAVTTSENAPLAITLSASDSDIPVNLLTYSVTSPAHGNLSGTAPDLLYTPNANFNGSDSFTFKVNDGTADSNVATVSITVNAVNRAPVAVDDTYTINEDTPLTVSAPGILSNDSDADSNPLTAVKVSDPAHGAITLNTDGSFSYTPAANYNGTDSFTYKANDGSVDSNIATVSITVNPVNNAPLCADTAITTNEDASGTVAPSCTDVDSTTLTYAIASQPSNGTAVVEADLLKYTPSADFNGSDSFTYTANDGTATSAPATVSVTVNPINDAPVADNQSVETNEDTPLSVTLSGSDAEGDTLTYALIASPTYGTLGGAVPNLTYTPNANFNGSDSFTFKVNDGTVDSASAIVQIVVNAINDPPVANADSYTTNENVQLTVEAPGVVLNDTDVDGNSLTASVLTGPAHGTLSLDVDGSFIYTPDSGYSGPDGFTYTASDGQGGTANGNVTITVNPVNHPPVANNQEKTTDEDVAVNIALTATDADNNSLTYTVTDSPMHGTLSGTAPNLTYTPTANYYGVDNFSFKASDGQVDSNIAVISLIISAVNDPPVIAGQSISTNEDTSLNVTLSSSDVDGDPLTYQIVTGPAHGMLSGTAPNLLYTPAANYSGPDNFTFKASDGTADSGIATVDITVTPVNDPPIVNNQSVTTAEDIAIAVTLTASDVENNPLTYTVLTNPAHGSLSGIAPNLTYTPALNFNGMESFTFKVNDGLADSNIATVNITVTSINDAPTATNDSATTLQDTPVTISVLANDSDVDGDLLTVIAATIPLHGTATINANSTITYSPSAGYTGADSFSYTISDSNGGTTNATVNITVTQNDLIFKDGFGSCSASAWTVVNSIALSFSSQGKIGCGMQVNIATTSPAYVRDNTPNLETRYRARFYFNPNGIVMGKSDSHVILGAYSATGNNVLAVELRKNGSSFQIRAGLLNDRSKWSYTGWSTIAGGWNSIEFDWRAATAVGANNGGLTLWLNGTQVANLTGTDNDLQKVEWIALGAVNGIDSRTRGTYYFDEFESRRSNYIGN